MRSKMGAPLNAASSGAGTGRLAALLLLTLAAVACAAAGAGSAPADRPAEARATVLEVENLNWQDMHIYVLAGGQRWSIGQVTSLSQRAFELPDGVFGAGRDIVFLADPVGSVVAYHSDPVLLEPGDRVEWTLQNRLSQSSLFVR